MLIKNVLEFRGCVDRLTKKGTKQFNLYFEGENGEGAVLHTTNEELAKSLNKGNRYIVAFNIDHNTYIFVDAIAPYNK